MALSGQIHLDNALEFHARALAHRMGIPHITLDLREPFRTHVVDDFVAGHAAGATPNPCVRCNGLVRFDAMLDLAEALGASRLATGHYARIEDDGRGPLLRAAAHGGKDQTYMLSRLHPEQLARLWFPLGELTKPEVRDLARAASLSVAERPEGGDGLESTDAGPDAPDDGDHGGRGVVIAGHPDPHLMDGVDGDRLGRAQRREEAKVLLRQVARGPRHLPLPRRRRLALPSSEHLMHQRQRLELPGVALVA